MKRAAISGVILGALLSLAAGAQRDSLTFSGEVSLGQTFRKNIGHGLDFVLKPSTEAPGKITGWTIEVSPRTPLSNSRCIDYVWVVTPPYRSYNTRYLDTSYGTTAQEAVRTSPRDFRFVLNCADFETESKRVEIILWRYNYSQKDADKALAELGTSPLGKGSVWIEDYKIRPGEESAGTAEVGVIDWIKFRVEIKFPKPSSRPSTP